MAASEQLSAVTVLLIAATFCSIPGSDGKLITGPTDASYVIGSDVRIPCQVEDTAILGIIVYTWHYNNSGVLPAWFKPCPPPNSYGDRCIANAQSSYTGSFECMAEDASQSLQIGLQTGLVSFIKPIVFRVSPRPSTVWVGSATSFSCALNTVLGSVATIEWWYRPLSYTPVKVTLNANIEKKANNSLHFNDVQDDQLGLYYCVASNAAGSRNASAVLGAFGATAPVIDRVTKQGVAGTLGGNVDLSCKVSAGRPSAVAVTWFKDTLMVRQSPPHLSIQTDGSLSIVLLSKNDEGDYTCEARNSLGITTSGIIDLQVSDSGAGPTDGSGSGSSSGLTATERTIVISVCAGVGGLLLLGVVAVVLLKRPAQTGGVRQTAVRRIVSTDSPSTIFMNTHGASMKSREGSLMSKKVQRTSLEQRMSRNYSDTVLLIKSAPDGDIADVTRAFP